MLTPTNRLDVPEITCYSRQQVEGGTVIRYLQRNPGERCWQPVTLFRPDEVRVVHQEAATDWYTDPDAEPFDEDVRAACGEPFCTGACILPPIA